MKKLFENWRKYTNEAYSSDGKWKSRFPDGRSKSSDVEPETDQARKHRREKEERRRREREALGYPPEKSKYFQENEYEPGRAVADIDTGEERMSPEDLMRDEVQDLADKFNVEASVEIASDGKPAILVTHRSGETTAYDDTEEMYRDLSDEVGRRDFGDPDKYEDEYEMYEGAVPHSAQHVVKKMKKTGLSAKEALKSLTTDLSDEEAERWLKRHKDEMDRAKKGD